MSAEPLAVVRQRFDDFDSLAEAISGWDLDWVQLDRGALSSEVRQVASRSALVTSTHFSRRFLQRGSSPPGVLTFGLIGDGVTGVNWCGRPVTDRNLLVFNPGMEYEGVSMPGFCADTVSMTEEHLAGVAADIGLIEVSDGLLAGTGVLDCAAEPLVELRRHLRSVNRFAGTGVDAAANAWLRHELESELPALLLSVIDSTRPTAEPVRMGVRTKAVQVGREFMDENVATTMTIRDVCVATSVSWRTLNYAFREQLGITPKAYLQALRFNGLRKDLRRAAPEQLVSDHAHRWGFWHMGQLAADYRRQFGELPSETLKRPARVAL